MAQLPGAVAAHQVISNVAHLHHLPLSVISNRAHGHVLATSTTRGKTPAYVAFDIVWLNGIDLRPLALRAMREGQLCFSTLSRRFRPERRSAPKIPCRSIIVRQAGEAHRMERGSADEVIE